MFTDHLGQWNVTPWAQSQYKDQLSRYGDFHYKDNTGMGPSRNACMYQSGLFVDDI